MRTLLVIVFLLVVSTDRISSAAADEPKAVIEKAIQAIGGAEKAAKLQAVRAKAKGTVNIGAEVPLTWVVTWQWPNLYKMEAELVAGDKKIPLVQGFDGATAWGGSSGAAAVVDGQKLSELMSQMHLRRILMLTPLITDTSYELSPLDDAMVGEKSAARIKVSAKGMRDVTLYFDRETGLLTKIERFVLDNATMKLAPQEDFLSNYQNIDGVKTAMKEVWLRSGVKVAEFEYTEIVYPAKIDVREFNRPATRALASTPMSRTTNVIYGRKFGMALTMDVFFPQANPNGAAVILVVSGGWVSDSEALNNQLIAHFVAEPVKRGYTVFAVSHGSQPKFTIPEVIADVNRAVRYIRHYAQHYQIDPDRIGITGGSAGGHLSLMQGTAGDLGNAMASDPVERVSSRVQAVACLFPPTNFTNYGAEGEYAFGLDGLLAPFRAAVDVREMNRKTFRLERPADEAKQLELAAKISPISNVSSDDPPTLIVHGDADKLVPIQQAESIVAKLTEAGVQAELIVRKGRGHDFAGVDKDIAAMSDWFDVHLKK